MVQIADIGRILGEASQAFCMRISPGNVITIGHARGPDLCSYGVG